jgi:hypothetical protein
MTSFVVLFVVTQFTAKMTVQGIETSKEAGAFGSIEDVVSANQKICGLQANKEAIVMRYPQISALYESVPNDEAGLVAMNSGQCAAAIVTADAWYQLKKKVEHCDKFRLPATVFAQDNAFVMREDLVAPFSWAMTRLQNKGIYSQMALAAKRMYIDPKPDSCAGQDTDKEDQDEWEVGDAHYVTGPILISFAVITVTLLAFIVYDFIGSSSSARKEGGIFLQPSVKYRICGKGCPGREQMSARKSCQDALSMVHENNADLKMISKLFEARHLTERRIKNRMKGDAPLTVSDVPMLVHLVQKSINGSASDISHLTSDIIPISALGNDSSPEVSEGPPSPGPPPPPPSSITAPDVHV